ncbi:MAG: tetratricopeptide repeat protein, partial [Planctomycetota bacterium]
MTHRFGQLASSPARGVLAALVALAWAQGPILAQDDAQSAQQESQTLDERIDRLIEELGNTKYSVRERAQAELAKLGFEAYQALLEATTHDDLEIATRAKHLLRLIPARWSAENEPEEVRRHLAEYQTDPPERRITPLKRLAQMSGGVGVPTLCRLVRFEKSELWSKLVAVVLMNAEPVDAAGRARWAKQVREHLRRSQRPAAQWIHAYLDLRDHPKPALARWTKLIEEEGAVLEHSPHETSPRAVAALLYHLAIAQADQGDAEAAEETADKARRLGAGNVQIFMIAHRDAALFLERRGRFGWAEREYRHVIDSGMPPLKAGAHESLAEMWHDQGNELAAAKTLEELL